jgi:hypothetical protein
MNTNTNYAEHVSIVKNLKMADSFYEVREPFKEGFEAIYNKANANNVNMSNAKDFLNSLTKEELSTLQNYTRLADEINVDNLSDEGAYNLLLHHYEKYDFNNDGVTEDGIAKTSGMIPQSLGNDEKKALVETFNSMDFKDVMTASILFIKLPRVVDGQLQPSNQDISLKDIRDRIMDILNPKNEKFSTQEFKNTIKNFSDLFELNYKKILEEKAYYNIR